MLDVREMHLEDELYQWPSIHELSPRSTSARQVMSQFPRLSMHDMIVDPPLQAQSVSLRSASRASLTGLIPLAPISPPSIPTSLNTSSSLTNASPLRSPSLITPVSFAHDALTRQAVEWTISSSLLVSGQQLSSMVAATDTVDVGPSIERKQSSVSDSQHEGIPALSFLTLGKGSECSDVFTCSVCE